jgi:tetratricopeptide (TPR) repeat protein
MKRWLWLMPVLLAAVVYAQAPWGELVWDDYFIAIQLGGLRSLSDIFFPPEGLQGWTYAYYRPVLVLSYFLDAALFGSTAAAGPHFTNLLYHLVATFFVWLLAKKLLPVSESAAMAAVLSAAIFAVHPIHTESVYWIAARGDILATLFLLPSIVVALAWFSGGKAWQLTLAGLLYLLALMSKEVAIAGLVIVPATLALARRESAGLNGRTGFKNWAILLGLYLSITLLYLLLRSTALPGDDAGGMVLIFANAFESFIRAGAFYFTKVFLPWPQSNIVVWEMLPGLAASLSFLLVGCAILFLAIRWWRRRSDGIPLLGALWFVTALAPSLVVAISDFSGGAETAAAGKYPVAERYLYLPSVGVALLLASLFCVILLTRWRKQVLMAGIAFIVVMSAATIYRGYIWNNNLRLWSDTTTKVTTHGPPWNELGRAYLDQSDDENALQSFLHALTLLNTQPERATISHNIGTIYLHRQNLSAAETYFRSAIELKPSMAEAQYGLGLVYTAQVGQAAADGAGGDSLKSKMNLAVSHFAAAIQIDPGFTVARLLSARILVDYGQMLEREGILQQAVIAYRSARGQIDAVIATIPGAELQPYIERWSVDLNVDLNQLSARIDTKLQRLDP